MHTPNSGRIVIVDDKIEEALPLIQAFGRASAPHLYYSGKKDQLPKTPLTGIRFVFLDIELSGMAGQSEKTKASFLTNILKRMISPSNGPYVIIFWTRHPEVIKLVKANISATKIEPIQYLETEKAPYITNDYELTTLTSQLAKSLLEVGAFHFYVEWENLTHSATNEFITEFSSLVPHGANWSKETANLFFQLYKAYVDNNDIDNIDEKFRCACLMMNRSFAETLHNTTSQSVSIPEGLPFKSAQANLSIIVKAKLNTSLFLTKNHTNRACPGEVYKSAKIKLKKTLIAKTFKETKKPSTSSLCIAIITPECDFAQNKTLISGEKTKIHQVIYGLLYKMTESSETAADSRFNSKGRESRYTISPIWHKGSVHRLVFNHSSVSFISEDEFKNAAEFSLSRDITSDLQTKSANNLNRLGTYLLK